MADEKDADIQKLYRVIADLKMKLDARDQAVDNQNQRLQTYAIDIDNAEKALSMKGVPLGKGESIATGIEKLYAKLTDKYAHEGGIPQVMTAEIATKWIASLSIPTMWDIFQTATPNVFYASFQKTLFPDGKAQLKALGFDAVVSDERFHARYMLKWNPPRNDEP